MLRNVGLRKSVEQPVLDLNFAASQIGSNAAPDSRIDFSRGSNAWFVDSDGLVKKSPHNLLTKSEDTTVWNLFNTTVSANAAESPTGELTADKSIPDSGATNHVTRRDISGIAASVDVVVSVYVKQAGFTSVAVQFYDKNVTFHSSGNFDLTDGSRISNATSGTQSSIEHVGNDWYRITFTGINTGTGSSNPSVRIGASGTGDGSKGFLIWGAQLSQHTTLPVGNPYIKTEASAVYAARLDHDPSWFMSAAQEQNLLEYSEMLDDSGWGKTRLNVTANATTAPDGTTTAEKIFDDSTSSATHNIKQAISIADATVTSTFSAYFKAAERDAVHLKVFSSNSASNYFQLASIDLANGTIGSTSDGGNGTASDSSITDVGDGWFRVTLTGIADTAAGSVEAQIFLNSGGLVYDGDGSSGVFVWGAQFEVGSTASTYHRTEGAPYYGEGATPKGLLIEEARTNIEIHSEDLSGTGWATFNSTVTTNQVLAPDGTTTADLQTRSSTSASYVRDNIPKNASAITYTASVFVKKSVGDYFALRLQGSYPARVDAIFNISTGAVHSLAAHGSFANQTSSIEDYGNGWLRCVATCTSDTHTELSVLLSFSTNATVVDGIDSASDSAGFVWGVQVEEGSFPTSYIKTTGSTATRNADVATMGPTTGGTELVTNGTFDTDTTGWDDFTGRSNISVSSGQLVVDVVDDTRGFVARTDTDGGYDPVVVPGRRYRLSADLKVNSGNGVEIDVYGNGSAIAATGVVTSSTLTTKTVDFTCPDGVTSVTLFVDNITPRATTDEYVVDNVSLRELYPFEQYNPDEGTLYSLSSCTGDDTHTVLSVHADSFDNYFSHTYRFGNSLRNFSKGGGSTELQTAEAVTLSNRNEIATTYDGTSMDMSANGSDETTGTLGADIVGIHEIAFGLRYTANQYSGHIERVQYFPRALPKVTLQSLTSD